MKHDLSMYRVYGQDDYDSYDEYCEASSAQMAANRVREWHDFDDESASRNYKVIEVSKVMKGWK